MNEDALVAKIVEALKEVMTPAQPTQPAQPASPTPAPAVTDDVNLSEKLDHISQQIEEITLNEPNPQVKNDPPKDDDPKDDEPPKEEELSDEEVEKMANILKL